MKLNAGILEEVLTGFIEEETRRAGRKKVVVGLSGGIDSAVVAALARKALGAKGVIAVMMPHRDSDPRSLKDARDLAVSLGIRHELFDITAQVEAWYSGLKDAAGAQAHLRRGNKMARERMSILYDRSAAHEALVIGTSNKTELLLGYGTVHGDIACALNPLGDLYKTQVRQMAGFLKIPAAIRRKPPSADLWPDQTDEGDLGLTYETVDRLLFLLIDQRGSRADAVDAGWDSKTVDRVTGMIVRSQFKRRMPILAKISARTVGVDFRYPRDWGT